VDLVTVRMFILKTSHNRSFHDTFKGTEPKMSVSVSSDVLHFLGVKKNSGHAHKTGYPLGVLFKISDKHLCPFYMGVHSWGSKVCAIQSAKNLYPTHINS